jgi:hypothetical protein
VFQPQNGQAVFRVVDVGLELPDIVEVRGGLTESETVITTGSAALRDGDRILLQGQDESGRSQSGAARAGDTRNAGRGGEGGSRQ